MLKNGVGTAFLIGKDLIMTNHHVLATREIAQTGKAVFFHLKDSQDRVIVHLDPEHFFIQAQHQIGWALNPSQKRILILQSSLSSLTQKLPQSPI